MIDGRPVHSAMVAGLQILMTLIGACGVVLGLMAILRPVLRPNMIALSI